MTRKLLKSAIAALAVTAISASPPFSTEAQACGCCGGQKSANSMSCMKGMDMSSMDNMSTAQKASDDAMMSGIDHSKMDMSGADGAATDINADVAFAKAMIPHHEAAVQMAKQLLKNGKNEEMKAMASEIIAAQSKEIKTLYGWLAKNVD